MIETQVRAAVDADARTIAEIQVSTMQHVFRGIVPDRVLDAFAVDRFIRTRAQMIPERRAQGGETFVAVREGAVIGFASCGPPRDADLDPATCGELYAIYARRETHRTGAGSALMSAVEEHFARHRKLLSSLWVFEQNAVARAFYEHAGYRRDGRAQENANFGDAPEVRYVKALG